MLSCDDKILQAELDQDAEEGRLKPKMLFASVDIRDKPGYNQFNPPSNSTPRKQRPHSNSRSMTERSETSNARGGRGSRGGRGGRAKRGRTHSLSSRDSTSRGASTERNTRGGRTGLGNQGAAGTSQMEPDQPIQSGPPKRKRRRKRGGASSQKGGPEVVAKRDPAKQSAVARKEE